MRFLGIGEDVEATMGRTAEETARLGDQVIGVSNGMMKLAGETGKAEGEAGDLKGEVDGAADQASRLDSIFARLDISGVTADALLLAERLGIAAQNAQAASNALNRDAGLPEAGPGGLTFGDGSTGASDPFLGATSGGLGFSDNPPASTTQATNSFSSAGISGGGGGGGVSQAERDAQREHNRLMKEAEAIYRSTRTEAEQYNMEVAKLNELHQKGYIGTEAYERALEDLEQQYSGAGQAAEFWNEKMVDFQDGLIDSIVMGKNLADTMRSLAQEIAKAALQAALFGRGPLAGGGAGLLGGLFPMFAGGVENFGGGMAVVGEKGPELVNLPKGSDVIPADKTRDMMRRAASQDRMRPPATSESGDTDKVLKAVTGMVDGLKRELKTEIVNVFDPSIVGQYLNSPEGERVLINTVQANREAL